VIHKVFNKILVSINIKLVQLTIYTVVQIVTLLSELLTQKILKMIIDKDAFSSGQILSKIWLAEELEFVIKKLKFQPPLRILILGGWYGLTNFILQIRSNLNIEKIRSIDLDQDSCENADLINNLWVWQEWKFKSLVDDANYFEYSKEDFNLIINTSVEHIDSKKWFDKIPNDTLVVLQSNNMDHEDHCRNHLSCEDLLLDFPLNKVYFSGEKLFEYPSWSFKRFMIIGKK